MRPLRSAVVLAHRWAGLVLAGFLVLAGLTGALLVWYEELDAALNPHLFRVTPPARDAAALDMLALREATARQTGEPIRYFSLRPPAPGHSVVFRPDNGRNEQIFVDPYTGRILGRRVWGDLGQGVANLMPFVYRLHDSLALGAVGGTLMGIVALLWTLDCFAGAYLTFPPLRRHLRPGWIKKWAKAWQLRLSGGAYKLNFDLHRAGGLWAWPMLFVLGWSSVAFNLSQVYDPVMRTLFAHRQEPARAALPEPNHHPALDWGQARLTGRRLMTEQAARHGFTNFGEDWFVHHPARNLYVYDARTSLDVSDRKGKTRLLFDADTGELLHFEPPTGADSGDTIRTWLTTVHRATLWGWPFRFFMTGMGLVVAMLSVTGIHVWWKKRKARRKSAREGRSREVGIEFLLKRTSRSARR